MSNTLFALLGSLAPVQGLWRRLGSTLVGPTRMQAALALGTRQTTLPAATSVYVGRPRIGTRAGTLAKSRINMPLRVVRVMECGHASHSGRMLISGRMADVCAELDRMVERESSPRIGA